MSVHAMFARVLTAFVCAAITGFAPRGALAADPPALEVKTGLWEVTGTVNMNGTLMPPSVLERIPPAQRAQAMESMKQALGSGSRTIATQSCVTADDLRKEPFVAAEDTACKFTSTTRTPRKMVLKGTCGGPVPRVIQMTLDVVSREQIRATMSSSGAGGSLDTTMNGKWISATCPAKAAG
jgi:hypothetical protein